MRANRQERFRGEAIAFFAVLLGAASCLDAMGAAPALQSGVVISNGTTAISEKYSAPTMVDWDNDGKKDLLIGMYIGASPSGGRIRYYRNSNTDVNPAFTISPVYIENSGIPLGVNSEMYQGAGPRVVDWNNDGKKDLVVGSAELSGAYVYIFLNQGTDAIPVFDGSTHVTTNGADFTISDSHGGQIMPFVVDWNNDGRKDLLCGSCKGYIYLLLNKGLDGSPYFTNAVCLAEGGSDLVLPHGATDPRSSPVVVDWDGDGKKDIIAGNADGNVYFYRNIGTDSSPAFNSHSQVLAGVSALDVGSFARPDVVDWNNDGVFDLVVGDSETISQVTYFQGSGAASPRIGILRMAVNDADGNGFPNPGEQLTLDFWLRNNGSSATNVRATLSTSGTNCAILTNLYVFGDMEIKATAATTNGTPFSLVVTNTAAAGTNLALSLQVQADGGYSVTYPLNAWVLNGLVAGADSNSVSVHGTVAIDVLTNDVDPEGLPISLWEISVAPTQGTAIISNSLVYYTAPDTLWVGSDELRYTITNVIGLVATGVVSVTITGAVPTINNDIGASSVMPKTATLNGWLVDVGSTIAWIWLYWGPTDGETSRTGWTNTSFRGAYTGTGRIVTAVSGLTGTNHYYYRYYASNMFGSAWAPSTTNFDTPYPDDDNDGMADVWEAYYFGGTNGFNGGRFQDYDGDKYCNLYEYIAGTDPSDSNSLCAVYMEWTNGQIGLSFTGLTATGIGYTNVTRYYSLEYVSNIIGYTWHTLSVCSNVLGNGTGMSYTVDAPGSRCYYRVGIHL